MDVSSTIGGVALGLLLAALLVAFFALGEDEPTPGETHPQTRHDLPSTFGQHITDRPFDQDID